MDNKVYIITKGEYSDYHICAVTLDKSCAEKLKKLFSDSYDEAEIEEYTPDELRNDMNVYIVEFPDGESQIIRLDEIDLFGASKGSPVVVDWDSPIRVHVYAKDEDHALKIAQDEYAKWKAKKEGIA